MTRIPLCITLTLLLLSTGFLSIASQKTPPSRRSLVAVLKDQNQIGCGCYFSFISDRRERCVFMSDPEDNARMNIDGSDVRLNLVKRVAPANEKVGRHSTEIYQAPGIKVTARYVTTAMCEPNEPGCESTSYDATFTVVKGNRQQTVKLEGACGC